VCLGGFRGLGILPIADDLLGRFLANRLTVF